MILAALVGLTGAASAHAQATAQIPSGSTVVLTSAAPVYLQPDSSRVPLRTLPAGTTATVDRSQGGWIRITFTDPQYGQRTGWIETRFVKVDSTRAVPEPTPRGETAMPPAATQKPAPSAAPRRPSPSVRVFAGAGFDRMASAESFEAVTGSATLPAYGGGVQGVDLWRRLFAEFAIEYSTTDGERVFVFDDEVFELGIPLKIKQLPIDLTGGWRFPAGPVTPFAGGGVTFLRYQEESDFADEDENIDEWHTGFIALAGVEVRLTRNLHLRGDFRYRRLDDALGAGGVSAVFGETALGGTGVSVKVVFGQ
jgi:opacity protein-like surface antigen